MYSSINLSALQSQILQLFENVAYKNLGDPGILLWEIISDYFPLEDASGQFWWRTTGFPFARLLFNAGYSIDAQCKHLLFYLFYVVPALGADQTTPGGHCKWQSFMTDSFTPIELSWEWGCPDDKPTIRYSIEPIGFLAGTAHDPANRDATSHLLQHFQKLFPGIDLGWFNHFSDQLLSYEDLDPLATRGRCFSSGTLQESNAEHLTRFSSSYADQRGIFSKLQTWGRPYARKLGTFTSCNETAIFEPHITPPYGLGRAPRMYRSSSPFHTSPVPTAVSTPSHKSRTFLAFDLHKHTVVVKGYLIPTFLAARTSQPTLTLIRRAITKLSLLHSVHFPAFDMLQTYLSTYPFGRALEPEIFSVDCLPSAQNRLKMYMRTKYTSLNSIRATLTLGGVLLDSEPLLKQGLYELEKLWKLVLGKTLALGADEELVVNSHRTAGVLYYFEMKPGQRLPVPKIYIPVRHYGQSDVAIEKGLGQYLREKGQEELVAKFGRVMQEMR